ncbi:MAG: hypothetical protein ABMA14_02440, partial [Hyphomonadaceae bacterium]
MRGPLVALAALFVLAACGGGNTQTVTLLNVSYDPTRELYSEVNEAFAKQWKEKSGKDLTV